MIRLTHLSISMLFLLLLSSFTFAQSESSKPSQEDIDRATVAFTRLLNSESQAQDHVKFLVGYTQRAPWSFDTLTVLTQRLAVDGIAVRDIDEMLTPCGDMALAINARDEGMVFARIVTSIAFLSSDPRGNPSVADMLGDLEESGVPVYRFLSEAFGKSPDYVRKIALADRLKGPETGRLLREFFTRHYGGLAAKLVEQKP